MNENRRAASEYSIVLTANVVTRGTALLTVLVATHALTPESFAAYTIGWALYNILARITSGWDVAYVTLRCRGGVAAHLDAAYRQIRVSVALVLAGIGILSVPILHVALDTETTALVVLALIAGSLASVLQIYVSRAQAAERFLLLGIIQGCLSVSIFLFSAGAYFAGFRSPVALVLAFPVSYLPLLIVLGWTARCRAGRSDVARPADVRAILSYGRPLLLSGVANTIVERLDIFLVAWLLSTRELGVYGLSVRLFGLFQLGITSLGTVLLPKASRLRGGRDLRTYLVRATYFVVGTSMIAVALGVTTGFWLPPLFSIEYVESVPLFRGLCAAAILLAIVTPLKYLFFAVDRPRHVAGLNVGLLFGKVTLSAALIPLFGVVGAVLSHIFAYALAASVAVLLLLRLRGEFERASLHSN